VRQAPRLRIHPQPAYRSDLPRDDVAPGHTWVQLAQNRFWLIIPILALDLALVSRLPTPWRRGASDRTSLAGWM